MNLKLISFQKIWWYLMVLITGLLLIFSIWNYSLIIGWMVAILFCLINHQIGKLFLKKIISKLNNYFFWWWFFKSVIFWIISLILLISIIMINKIVQGKSLWTKNLEAVFYPINLFTLLGGITIMKFYPITLIKME